MMILRTVIFSQAAVNGIYMENTFKKSCHFIRWNINGLCLFLPHQHNIVASISDALVVDLMKPAQNPGQPILIGIIHNGFHLFFCEKNLFICPLYGTINFPVIAAGYHAVKSRKCFILIICGREKGRDPAMGMKFSNLYQS